MSAHPDETVVSPFELLGELGRDGATTSVLARDPRGGAPVVVTLPLAPDGAVLRDARPLAVERELGRGVPAPAAACQHCGGAIEGWDRFCQRCGRDVSGVAPDAAPGTTRVELLAAVREAAAGRFDVLGEMPRAEGGGMVYFARDLDARTLVALRLLPRAGADGAPAYSLGVTTLAPRDADALRAAAGPVAAPSGDRTASRPVPDPAPAGDAAGAAARPPKLCPTCHGEYDGELLFCPRDGSQLHSTRTTDELEGQVVAGFLVQRKLDEGGMGQVYLAQHLRMTGKRVAIKVLRRALREDEGALARFQGEAEHASRINHPHVATIYDFGETSDGMLYLVMEYVPGEPLQTLLDRDGPLDPTRAAAIVSQIAAGLDAAHELPEPIVHRDLKPQNVMIARNRDGTDCVKLLDFGISKTVQGGDRGLTATGYIIGTPDYMAPEQAEGLPDAVDIRSDVYALGLLAFTVLTGALAFPGETPQARMVRRLSTRPRALATARPQVAWPVALQSVLDRALARDRAERYQSAGAFGEDFAAAVAAWQQQPRRRSWVRTTDVLRRMAVLPSRVFHGAGTNRRPLVAGLALGAVALAGVAAASRWGDAWPTDRTRAGIDDVVPPTEPPTPVDPTFVDPTSAGDGAGPVTPALASADSVRLAAETRAREAAEAAARRRERDSAAADRRRRDSIAAEERRLAREELARLERLTAQGSMGESTAREVVAGVERLLPRLRRAEDRVAAEYFAAQAHGALGDGVAACAILRRIRAPARQTALAAGVARAYASGCEPY